ncbi:hypothetical protein ACQ4PT_010573 [Festuca glaucescens]
MEDQYMEDIAQGARFDDTDDEEKDENNDSLVLADYEGDDLPTIEWNRADPQLAEGTVFQTMMDCRNALTTYCILSKNDYEVIKSEPGRFTVKCPYKRCRWRLHASTMLRSTLVQIKKNPVVHTCPPRGGAPEVKSKLAKTRLCKNAVDPAFGMEDQAGAANAEENEAAIQNEEIEAAIQHEEIEAAIQPMEIEAAIQHEEIEAAIQPMDRELLEPMDRELLEPMDREQREQMDRELLEPMDREQREQMDREAIEEMISQMSEQVEEQIVEAREENALEERAQASYDMVVSVLAQPEEKKKNKKEGKRKVDTGNIPGRVTRNLLMMKNTKTAAVPTVVIDAKIIEVIAYNIASTAQIQPSMSEPVDVSLPLPSSDPLLMKDTKTAAVPTVVIDAKIIEAIAYNIASTAQIQPSSMSHFRCRECESMPRRLKPSSTTAL